MRKQIGFFRFPKRALVVVFIFTSTHILADKGDSKFVPVESGDVTVGGEIGRRVHITAYNNLLKLDLDRDFLDPFRNKTGPVKGPHKGYIGLGKLIDSAVTFAKHTNDTKIIDFKNYLVNETIKLQEPDGYIGFYAGDERMWEHWSGHEMVYIIQGLVSDYNQFGNQRSLDAAIKVADFILNNWPNNPDKISAWDIRWLGLDRAFLGLYAATQDKQYYEWLKKEMLIQKWQVLPAAWRDDRHGKNHAYTFISHCIAQMDIYRFEKDKVLLRQSRRVVDYLLDQDGMLINGGLTKNEHFHTNQDGCDPANETCAIAYLLRMLHHLMQFEPDSLYGDMMERTIYNALFAAQSPEGRRLRYETPFEGEREYWPVDTYCCPCNFRRIIAELPGMIYYQTHDGPAINLYTPSATTIRLDHNVNVKIGQETDYPNSGKVILHIDPSKPAEFSLKLRIPRWCDKNVEISVNNKKVGMNIVPGSFFEVKRAWQKGDRIELNMPMSWRIVKGRKDQLGLAAVMRGPMLFCLNVDKNESLKKIQPQLLHRIHIDTESLGEPFTDSTIRPDGQAVNLNAWSPRRHLYKSTNRELILTEYPDPGGRATYFRIPNIDEAVDDELFRLKIK